MNKVRTFYRTAYQQIFQIFSANMLKAGAGFVGTIFVLRGWSSQDIGDIYTLVGVFLLLNQFGDLGTGGSFIQLMSAGNAKKKKEYIATYLGFKQLVCIGFLLLACLFFAIYALNPSTREFLAIGLITLTAAVHIYSSFFVILITARQQFSKLSAIKVLPPTIKSLAIIALYFAGFRSFFWILAAFILPTVVSFIMGLSITKYPIYRPFIGKIFSQYGRQLYNLSKWVFFIGFLNTWFSQIDIFMLKRMSNDYQIAQFVGAQRISTIVLMMSQAIFTVMLPKMKSYATNQELINLNKRILLAYGALFLLAFPVAWASPYLLDFFLGGRYLDAIPILKVFIFCSIGYMFISTQSLIFYRKNKLPLLVAFSAVQLFLNFVGNYMVIIEYKAYGVIWISSVLNNLFFIFMSTYCFYLLNNSSQPRSES